MQDGILKLPHVRGGWIALQDLDRTLLTGETSGIQKAIADQYRFYCSWKSFIAVQDYTFASLRKGEIHPVYVELLKLTQFVNISASRT
jgi:hypothetical protein